MDRSQPSVFRYIPNCLSVLRILLIPVVIWLVLDNKAVPALIAFAIGALTDFLDGQLARRCGWHSHVGALMDPVADKLFVLCLMPLMWNFGPVVAVFAVLVIVRYAIQLTVFPVLMGWLKRPFKVAPRFLPKLATAVAFLVLGLGLLQNVLLEISPDYYFSGSPLAKTIGAISLLGSLLEIYVLVTFVPRYWQIIRGKHDTFE
ncbi:CDP-alcohol phosphatidyltransferase family protein [Microbulbifer sediminum]|uniref:CDP-alcohol phosphatidyltransferase family protein n=1 Tax=Microbulbifer sediminum TaxID=2904250 RepID=UPI001F2FFB0D|nr:CDP-alcohol phosphatidyltransferase family protein [Microbulbifer sediminum]